MDSRFKRVGNLFFEVIQTIVLALAIFMIVYLFALQPHQVDGSSMVPNFETGEYLLTDKISYRLNPPKRGDVIVFKSPTDRKKDFIKRIIGLPGEDVMIRSGDVYIDGAPLIEQYLPDSWYTNAKGFLTEGRLLTLKEGEYFVLGDNRDHSSDSREWGPIEKKAIIGRAWVIYWPLKKIGTLPDVTYSN